MAKAAVSRLHSIVFGGVWGKDGGFLAERQYFGVSVTPLLGLGIIRDASTQAVGPPLGLEDFQPGLRFFTLSGLTSEFPNLVAKSGPGVAVRVAPVQRVLMSRADGNGKRFRRRESCRAEIKIDPQPK